MKNTLSRYLVTWTKLSTGEGKIESFKTLRGATTRAAQLHAATGVKVWDSVAPIGQRRVTRYGAWTDPTIEEIALTEEQVFRGFTDKD